MQNKKILVTGADGFIGASLVSYLVERGYNVVANDKQFRKRPNVATIAQEIYKLGYQFVGDRGFHDIDVVVHLGASSLLGPSVNNPSAYFDNNVMGTKMLLDDIKRIAMQGKKIPIIFASSAAVYPANMFAIQPKLEHFAGRSPNPYGATKFACETMFEAYANAYGMPSVALRFFNVVGVYGQFSQMLRGPHILPSIFAAYQDKKTFKINGGDFDTPDGTCVRDYISVVTICDAIHRLVDAEIEGFQAYNLSSGIGTSNREIIDIVSGVVKNEFNFKIGPRRPGDPGFLIGDNRKFTSDYGELHQESIESIIQKVYNYYTERGIINDN